MFVIGVTPSGSTIDNDWLIAGSEPLMSILLIISLVIVVLAITVYMVSTAKPEPEPESEETGKGEFSAVTIDFGESDACPAVRKILGQRFLCENAPALPLVDCTRESCACTYRHHDDRRAGLRRAEEKGVVQGRYEGIEKRAWQRGRRADDTFADTIEQEKKQFCGTHEDTYHDFIEKTGSWAAPNKK